MQETSTGSALPLPARILIVDADPDALRTLSDSVTGLGYAVCHAAVPGPAAVDLPAEARPDLALIGLAAGETAAPAVETAGLIAERFGVPLVYAMETADTALLDRTQRTNPHGYVLKSAGLLQLDLTIRAALNATARERADRERQAGAMAGLKASAELAERNNAILRCLFERISDAVIVGDTQGRLTAINPAARRIGNASLEDPNRWTEYFATYQGDGRTPFALEDMPLARALRGETTQGVPVLLRPLRPDAGTADVWLSASGYPLLDAQGRSLGGAVLLRDVTPLREQSAKATRAQAELHERVQVLDAIIRSMADGVVVADAQARFKLFNPSAERIVGNGMTDRPPDEWPDIYGVYYADGSTPVPADQLPVIRATRGETVEGLELFVRNPGVPDGVFISVNASPLRDEAGQVVGGVTVFRDVTERRLQEEALTQAFALGRLEVIDTVLHNIGNAINSVATGVDTLHVWFDDNELMRRFGKLADLVAAHDRDWTAWLEHDAQGRQMRPFLLALVRDLTGEHERLLGTIARVRERVRHIVDIIRTQAAFTNGTVERKIVDLPSTIKDAVKVVEESLGQRGVEIEVDCARAPDQVLLQESRFQQMLVNLLKNAMEATDERAVRLEDGPDWRPRIRVLAYRGEQKNTLVIDVIDNGIGIDPSRFGSLFNAGYTTKKDGTGLGLHSAANFVIGSGGGIRPLSDGIGHGATLRVTLRLAEEQGQQQSPTRSP